MAHEFDTGFTVREPAWHGLANVLEDYPDNWDEARMAAGLMWEPAEKPVFTATVGEDETERYEEIEGKKAIVRDDTEKVLGVVSDRFTPFRNADLGGVVEAILGQGGVEYETAGSLRDGQRVWALVKIDQTRQPNKIDKSPWVTYAAILNSHDGSSAVKMIGTNIRIVCQNTWSAAEARAGKSGTVFSFRHTGDVTRRILEAEEAIALLRGSTVDIDEINNYLAGLNVNAAQTEAFVDNIFPLPEHPTDRELHFVRKGKESLNNIIEGPTIAGSNIAGTAYGLAQAAGEYYDHYARTNTLERKFEKMMIFDQKRKAQAVKIAEECALTPA